MIVAVYHDQAAFDLGCHRDGDGAWADYAPGEIPDCAGCDAEIRYWPVIAVSLPRLHERIMLCLQHTGDLADALDTAYARGWEGDPDAPSAA